MPLGQRDHRLGVGQGQRDRLLAEHRTSVGEHRSSRSPCASVASATTVASTSRSPKPTTPRVGAETLREVAGAGSAVGDQHLVDPGVGDEVLHADRPHPAGADHDDPHAAPSPLSSRRPTFRSDPAWHDRGEIGTLQLRCPHGRVRRSGRLGPDLLGRLRGPGLGGDAAHRSGAERDVRAGTDRHRARRPRFPSRGARSAQAGSRHVRDDPAGGVHSGRAARPGDAQ